MYKIIILIRTLLDHNYFQHETTFCKPNKRVSMVSKISHLTAAMFQQEKKKQAVLLSTLPEEEQLSSTPITLTTDCFRRQRA